MNEVVTVSIENFMGIASAELRFGKPTRGKGRLILITGENGEGKSSLLRAIEAIFLGEHDASVIRDGAECARVRMVLADGTEVMRTITRSGREAKVIDGEGAPVRHKVETYLKSLAAGFGFNPLDFCCHNGNSADARKKKQRIDWLMMVCPMTFTLAEITSPVVQKYVNIPGDVDLVGLNKIIRQLSEARPMIATRRDDRAAAAQMFGRTLAANDAEATEDVLPKLEQQHREIAQEEAAEIEEIDGQIADARRNIGRSITAANNSLSSVLQTILTDAQNGSVNRDVFPDVQTRSEALANAVNALARAEADAQEAKAACRVSHSSSFQELAVKIAEARAAHESSLRMTVIRSEMERCQNEAQELAEEWDAIDLAIRRLDAIKKTRLREKLTIDGLEIRDDDDIYIHGRQFDEWNTAAQYMKAMEIGAFGAGDCGLLIADQAECLGPAAMEEIEQAVVACGLTFVMARVASPSEVAAHGAALRSSPSTVLIKGMSSMPAAPRKRGKLEVLTTR